MIENQTPVAISFFAPSMFRRRGKWNNNCLEDMAGELCPFFVLDVSRVMKF